MSSHARHNDTRRYREALGVSHTQALRQVRDQLPPARSASRAAAVPVWEASRYHRCCWPLKLTSARWAIKHLNEVTRWSVRIGS